MRDDYEIPRILAPYSIENILSCQQPGDSDGFTHKNVFRFTDLEARAEFTVKPAYAGL